MARIVRCILGDPFVWFLVFAIALPPIKHAFECTDCNPASDAIAYFTDASFLSVTLLMVGLALYGSVGSKPLDYTSCLLAHWFLLNGTYIHILFDGLAGIHKKWPLMHSYYLKLDRRFYPDSTHWASVALICNTEVFVMAPMCIATYLTIRRAHPARDAMILITCVLQWFGTLVFYGEDIIMGIPNQHPGHSFFVLDDVIFFWFAFVFCASLWFIVPVVLGYRAVQRITNTVAKSKRE